MQLLTPEKVKKQIFIDPLLEASQINEVTTDLRLGCDFLVSILSRKPSIELLKDNVDYRNIESFFQITRRDIGDKFILYPNQVVITTTLEYVALPDNVYADILSRSSYTRLGIHINTMVQPAFRGCFPLELFNHSNNPIELVVGSRIVQARFFELEDSYNYKYSNRKYYGNIRPTLSKASDDKELDILKKLAIY